MRKLNISNTNKKKVRGVSRKVKNMVESINEHTQVFPEQYPDRGYRHLHMPIAQSFIDSKNTPNSIKRFLIQTLVDRIHHLYEIRSEEYKDARIVLVVCERDLRDSQIIVFFSKDYFDGFFDRKGPEQTRELLGNSNNMVKKRNIDIPSIFKIKTYKERIIDEDFIYETKLIFIGEL